MKQYRIKLTYSGDKSNNSANPLIRCINESERFTSRHAAAEAIFKVLYDTISEFGLEGLPRPSEDYGMLYSCDRQGNSAEPLCDDDKPYSRDDAISVLYNAKTESDVTFREVTIDDECPMADYLAVNGDGEIVGYYQFREDEYAEDKYQSACLKKIEDDGFATNDGVTAYIVEFDMIELRAICDEGEKVTLEINKTFFSQTGKSFYAQLIATCDATTTHHFADFEEPAEFCCEFYISGTLEEIDDAHHSKAHRELNALMVKRITKLFGGNWVSTNQYETIEQVALED